MKRSVLVSGLVALFLISSSVSADTVHVQVRSTAVRQAPKAWAGATAFVSYGDELSMLGAQDGWMKVKTKSGQEGFIHPSALTTKKVVLAGAGSRKQAADRSDIVLAGKGFNRDVEKQFAAANATLNYAAVDSVERNKVKASDLASFIKTGKLKG